MRFLSSIKSFLVVSVLFISTACSTYTESGVLGGVVGGGIGAGTGAWIGHAMSRSTAAEGALVGTAIGVPVGILTAVLIQAYIEKKEIDNNNEIIEANARYIAERQRNLDVAREALVEDSIMITPNKKLRSEIYTGPTIGVYNR